MYTVFLLRVLVSERRRGRYREKGFVPTWGWAVVGGVGPPTTLLDLPDSVREYQSFREDPLDYVWGLTLGGLNSRFTLFGLCPLFVLLRGKGSLHVRSRFVSSFPLRHFYSSVSRPVPLGICTFPVLLYDLPYTVPLTSRKRVVGPSPFVRSCFYPFTILFR